MASDFGARIDELIESVGEETLTGSVVVDQVYAKYQHERMDLKHPQGGQAKYLGGPVLSNAAKYVQKLADNVLHGSLENAMKDDMEDLAQEVFDKAPREFWDLRESAHPSVMNGEESTYDRPPTVPRLTEEQLKVKDKLRNKGLGGGAGAGAGV
jgi:hypothetical protein